ncbi:MAG: DinB family protein [Candidatus Acidiferrales bacterium]
MLKRIGVIRFAFLCAMLSGISAAQSTSESQTADTPATAAKTAGASSSAFVKSFEAHWATARTLALSVADAMPAEQYSFKPNPDEMSFGEQMAHIAQANYEYCAFIEDAKSPYVAPAKDVAVEKAAAIQSLAGSFDYCAKIFDSLTDAQLNQIHVDGDRKFATRDVMLGLMIHMAHHRGQAEVYLRLKGITPPTYKW